MHAAIRRTRRLAGVLLSFVILTLALGPAPAWPATGPAAPALPRVVFGGYWENWGPVLRLADVPRRYGAVYVGFALGASRGSGAVAFTPSYDPRLFAADVAALKRQGRPVLISVGGWFDLPGQTWGYRLDSPLRVRQFLASIDGLVRRYGFSGVDFDLEHGNFDVPSALAAARALKARYGAGFLVSAAPAPWRGEYLTFARRAGAALDLITPQYYDAGLTEAASYAQVLATTRRYLAAGVPASKIGIGVRTVSVPGSIADTPDTVTVATVDRAWRVLRARYPRLRGVVNWSINLDASAGYAFARQSRVR